MHGSDVHTNYRLSDVARILCVSPGRIRRWLQLGLLEPVNATSRPLSIAFQQLAAARGLRDQLARRTPLKRMRAALARVRRWHAGHPTLLGAIGPAKSKGCWLLRVGESLFDTAGQRYFDFSTESDVHPIKPQPQAVQSVEQLFTQALELEDAGEMPAAARIYREAIALDPTDPVLHYNLGNVLMQQGEADSAIRSYRKALEYDAANADVWNNLGYAYREIGERESALRAFRRAVRLSRQHEQAHENLAELVAATVN